MTPAYSSNHSNHPQKTTFGYLTRDYPTLDRVQNAISALCGVIAGLSVVAMGVLTLIEVFSRTLLRAPVAWVPGFIEQPLMVAAAFFGLVTAYRSGAHVAIVSLFNRFSEPIQKVLLIFSYLVIIGCVTALMVSGWRAMAFSMQINEIMPPGMAELSVPMWIWKAIVPLSMALANIVVLIDLFREMITPWGSARTNYEPGHAGAEIQNAPQENKTYTTESGDQR